MRKIVLLRHFRRLSSATVVDQTTKEGFYLTRNSFPLNIFNIKKHKSVKLKLVSGPSYWSV